MNISQFDSLIGPGMNAPNGTSFPDYHITLNNRKLSLVNMMTFPFELWDEKVLVMDIPSSGGFVFKQNKAMISTLLEVAGLNGNHKLYVDKVRETCERVSNKWPFSDEHSFAYIVTEDVAQKLEKYPELLLASVVLVPKINMAGRADSFTIYYQG